MIDKISFCGLNSVRNNTTFRGKTEDKYVANNVNCPNGMCGTEALGAYNKGLININKDLDIKPLPIINIKPDEIENGEKIYSSDGELHSIVQNDGQTKTEYRYDKDNPEKAPEIVKTDLNTGNIILKQGYQEWDDSEEVLFVKQYDTKTGKIIHYSEYNSNGELYNTNKITYRPDGTEVYIGHSPNYGYYIDESNEKLNFSSSVNLDENKQVTSLSERKNRKNTEIYNRVEMYKGAVINIQHSEDIVVPNAIGRDVFTNPEVTPAQKFIADIDYKSHEGNKTYYSNGAIESNEIDLSNGKAIASFEPDGSLTKIVFDDKTVEFKRDNDGEKQTITEKTDKDTTKTTTFHSDGHVDIEFKTPEVIKRAEYQDNGNPQSYREEPIDENNSNIPSKRMYFNKEGMLENAW